MLVEESGADPGLTVHDGMDFGTWLAKQRHHAVWQGPKDAQRELLEAVGVTPLPPEWEAPAKGASVAFERGIAALLAQHKARTGSVKVPRAHVETIVVDGQEHSVMLGVFLSNSKSRRAKLTADKLQQLADHGLDWAAA
ncbi:helicase associated domain-containing protein [Streptomyces sp. NPDC006372]|uniref:helicase associated domain-containing protein n=1 Tax=Streptomyces sp. NPDC006372 TaxID=3155599 RepID=UPI0033B2B43D